MGCVWVHDFTYIILGILCFDHSKIYTADKNICVSEKIKNYIFMRQAKVAFAILLILFWAGLDFRGYKKHDKKIIYTYDIWIIE